jgi:hypothetical protein
MSPPSYMGCGRVLCVWRPEVCNIAGRRRPSRPLEMEQSCSRQAKTIWPDGMLLSAGGAEERSPGGVLLARSTLASDGREQFKNAFALKQTKQSRPRPATQSTAGQSALFSPPQCVGRRCAISWSILEMEFLPPQRRLNYNNWNWIPSSVKWVYRLSALGRVREIIRPAMISAGLDSARVNHRSAWRRFKSKWSRQWRRLNARNYKSRHECVKLSEFDSDLHVSQC